MKAPAKTLDPSAIARLRDLSLIARWIVEGFISGLHASPYHGFSVEFAEYRQYALGDDLRFLDWKALAKSDRRYVKKFHSETNMRAHVLVDCSASMGFGESPPKLAYARAVAAALAYLMVLQQDAAGLVLFADDVVDYVRPRATMQHFREIAAKLDAARPKATTNMSRALHRLAETVKARGLFVVISDLYDDPEQVLSGLRHLRFKKHEVLVFHLLDKDELTFPYRTLSEFRDLETNERVQVLPQALRPDYLRSLGELTASLRRSCSAMKVDYQLIDTSVPFERVLSRYLFDRQRLG